MYICVGGSYHIRYSGIQRAKIA